MRGAKQVTLQHYQILHLPGKMTFMLSPPQTWNVQYNARSNTRHPPTWLNTAPPKKTFMPVYFSLLYFARLFSALLLSSLLYSTLLFSTLLDSTFLFSSLLYSSLHYSLYSTLLFNTLLYSSLLVSTLLDVSLLFSALLLYSTLLCSYRLFSSLLCSTMPKRSYIGGIATKLLLIYLHEFSTPCVHERTRNKKVIDDTYSHYDIDDMLNTGPRVVSAKGHGWHSHPVQPSSPLPGRSPREANAACPGLIVF